MFGLGALLKRKNTNALTVVAEENKDIVAESRNWYSDRYETVLVQRNVLLLIIVLCLVAAVLCIITVRSVTLSKSVDPFVIEVEERSGITNVVNPLSRRDLTTNEALQTYFLMKYLRARETYDSVDYQYNYSTVVRLLSTAEIYKTFKNDINNNPRSPVKIYGANTKTTLKVRSVQFLEQGKAQIRFTVIESVSGVKYDKIATITFDFSQMEMTAEERYVNPLGFQIIGYRVDDEIL